MSDIRSMSSKIVESILAFKDSEEEHRQTQIISPTDGKCTAGQRRDFIRLTEPVAKGSTSFSVGFQNGAGVYIVSADANIASQINPKNTASLGWSNLEEGSPACAFVIAQSNSTFLVNFSAETTQAGAITVYKLELSVS